MRALAIDDSRWLFYEGTYDKLGHAVWPVPTISSATVLKEIIEINAALPRSNFINEMKLAFREDSFDPVTRVRRGRLYKASDSRPEDWRVQPHPALPEETRYAAASVYGDRIPKRLYAFYAWPAMKELGGSLGSTLVALGTQDAYTLWRIVDIERIVTGEDLITLRARSALGTLPELNEKSVPSEDIATVSDVLERLTRAAYTADAVSVVHLARDAASCCLGVWLADRKNDPKLKEKDLGDLAKLVENESDKAMLQVVAKLHSRAKPNEEVKHGTRSVHQGDAEFAVSAIGILIRELGWAI